MILFSDPLILGLWPFFPDGKGSPRTTVTDPPTALAPLLCYTDQGPHVLFLFCFVFFLVCVCVFFGPLTMIGDGPTSDSCLCLLWLACVSPCSGKGRRAERPREMTGDSRLGSCSGRSFPFAQNVPDPGRGSTVSVHTHVRSPTLPLCYRIIELNE